MGSLPDVIIKKKGKNGLSNNTKAVNTKQFTLNHTKSATNLWKPLKAWNSSKPVHHNLPKRPQTHHKHHLTVTQLENGNIHIPVHLRDPDTLYEQTMERTFRTLERPVHIPLHHDPIQKSFHENRETFKDTLTKNKIRWADENETYDMQFIDKVNKKSATKKKHIRQKELKTQQKWKNFKPKERVSTVNYREKQQLRRVNHKVPQKGEEKVEIEQKSNAELLDAIYNDWASKNQ
mmetsp:Transcript_2429/g.3533  ORF Transcript_2429/g.3533 Transcript_2429/m.3533 type:complete len:234 (-) Transcript_2429:44-745(-)